MSLKKIRAVGGAVLVILWLVLTAAGWFAPAKELSEAERRPLARFPALSGESLLSGKFMSGFEEYSLDQFPLRDTFRGLKALFHYNVLGQSDNNGIYIRDGHAARILYPMNGDALDHNLGRLQLVYEKYLADTDSKIFVSVVPDKGFYLAAENGYPSLDYREFFDRVRAALPWAEFVDITGDLSAESYYFTDTHWRQEALLPAAGTLSGALGVTLPRAEDFAQTPLDRPFYGVYYGQAALPMAPETMYLMDSLLLTECTVYDHETGQTAGIYDMTKLTDKDLYNVFLSGSRSLLTLENPNARTDRELIVFRDSFGSSMVPLLVQDYATVTVVDIRYLTTELLGNFVEFRGQDVLFLYSTSVLNSENALK